MKKQFKKALVLCIVAMLTLSSCGPENITPAESSTQASTSVETQAATQADGSETEATTEVATEVTTGTAETDEPATDAPETSEPITNEPATEAATEVTADATETNESATDAPETSEPVTNEPATEAATEDPLAKYQLGYSSTMDMSAYDPVTNKETVIAPDDDASLKLWFDHITQKVARYDTSGKDSGKSSYTIQMGKNEMEGCQFFLYYPTEKRITVKISDFTNESGETLQTELGVEYYIEDGYLPYHGYTNQPVYPDAVVPYESYISKTEGGNYEEGAWVTIGPYSYKPWDLDNYPYRDTSRGFVVQAKTTADTTPGSYKATIEIFDADTGECIKMANVYTYVYNVTLSEETALDTTFLIWPSNILEQYAYLGSSASHYDILKATADFLLEYRITPTGTLDFGTEWLSNPRVTTIRVASKEQYDALKNDPVLSKKMYYYGQDEPGTSRPNMDDITGYKSIEKLMEEANMLVNEWGWTDYRMVSPFELDLNYTKYDSLDQIDFMSRYVNIWCPKFFSFTPRELKGTTGSKFTQSLSQDNKFGEFEDRIDGYVAEGDELWVYVSCTPAYTSPYQNILLFNDGTEARTMFWTCYDLDATGFLYWHVANYVTNNGTPGGNTFTMRCPFPKEGPGDGILIYPGAVYGQLDPIPSIRLINMREGIEDYQLLSMLQEAMGEAYTDELVHHIVTSTITFTRDDDVVYNVHSYLLRALENALSTQ